jgi:cytosine deaminase
LKSRQILGTSPRMTTQAQGASMSFDLIVKNAILPDGRIADIGINGETIAAIEPAIQAEAGRVVDASGCLVSPPFVDPHVLMDATLS